MIKGQTTITRKGQITVPIEIRQALGLKKGDRLAITLTNPACSEITVRPLRSVAELTYGAITPRKQPEDFKELRRIVLEDIAEEIAAEGRTPDSSAR